MEIILERPKRKDTSELKRLFTIVVKDAFERDMIGDRISGIREEVKKQLDFLNEDFKTKGRERFFLLAKSKRKIVGTASIRYSYDNEFKKIPELSSLYVLPKYQGKGIGSILINARLLILMQKGFKKFCLDGGYKKSQKIWIKKYGKPDKIWKDYYGKGLDYMIWVRETKDYPPKYKV